MNSMPSQTGLCSENNETRKNFQINHDSSPGKTEEMWNVLSTITETPNFQEFDGSLASLQTYTNSPF